MSVVDSAMTRDVMREIARRPVDVSGLEVHVNNGVAYLKGNLDKLRGYYEDLDLHEELNSIIKALRVKSGIRDVICEVELAGPSLKERTGSQFKHHSY